MTFVITVINQPRCAGFGCCCSLVQAPAMCLLPDCHLSSSGYLFGSRFVSAAWMSSPSDGTTTARQWSTGCSLTQKLEVAKGDIHFKSSCSLKKRFSSIHITFTLLTVLNICLSKILCMQVKIQLALAIQKHRTIRLISSLTSFIMLRRDSSSLTPRDNVRFLGELLSTVTESIFNILYLLLVCVGATLESSG